MESTPDQSRPLSFTASDRNGQSWSIVEALNQAAASLQQSALSVEEVYDMVRQQLVQLGLRGAITLLDESEQSLTVVAVAVPATWRTVLTALENQTQLYAEGYKIPLHQIGVMGEIIAGGRARYLTDVTPVVLELIPANARWVERPILQVFGGEPAILAPLISRGKPQGILGVLGPKLSAGDVPALQAFANHIAIALENARLISELRDSEERYRHLVEHAPNAVAVHRNGKLVYVNPAALRLVGANSPAQVIGRSVLDFVHPDSQAIVQERVRQLLVTGEPQPPAEEQFVRLDGKIVHVEVASTPFLYQGEMAIQVVIQDISDRKRVEQERSAAERISEAAYATPRLDDLFKRIHEIVAELMPAKNFYISLYEEASQTLSYPYAVDEREKDWSSHRIGRGFTAYVINTGQSLLAPPDVFAAMVASGQTELLGKPCVDWLGVPLRAHNKIIGVVVVQTYTEETRLTEGDKRVLEFVSTQVAMAIERKRTEEELRRRDAILTAVGYAAGQFLSQTVWQETIAQVLEQLGQAGEVSRAYIFENHLAGDGRLLASQRYEWSAPGILPQIGNPELQALDYERDGFQRLPIMLGQGQAIVGHVREFPETEQPLLRLQCIASLVLAPVFVGGQWWGFLGFDECLREREWSAPVVEALRAAADTLGAAIERQRTEHALQQRAAEFTALYAIARDLAAPKDLPALLQTIVERGVALVAATAGDMYLYDPERQELEVIVSTDQTIPLHTRLKHGEGMAGRVAQTRQPLIVSDYSQWEHRSPQYDGVEFRAVVEVPMLYGGALVGVLALHERGEVTRQYTEADARLLSLIAALAAGAVHTARLFEATRRQLGELEAANQISIALRAAQNVDEIILTLLDQTLAALNTEHGSIWLFDSVSQTFSSVAARGWFARLDTPPARPDEGIAGRVLATGEPHFSREFAQDSFVRAAVRPTLPRGFGGACIPFRTSYDAIVGAMFVSVKLPRELTQDEMRLLSTVAEIAGIAIQRSRLHEQTERRLQRLMALHAIETAITASLDLNVTLNVLLDHVTAQLTVDAASVLLFNPLAQTLEYAAGRGFRAGVPPTTRVKFGEGYAGRAALERRVIHVTDLRNQRTDMLRSPLYAAEGFVTMFSVPLVAKGRVVGVLEIFCRSALSPDSEWQEFLETLAQQAALAIDDAELFSNLQRSNVELSLAYDTTLEAWARALELRDAETEGHTRRVVELAERLGRAMGLSEQDLAQLRRGALLHDIGKVGIPDSILRKPGPLSEEEWVIMRRHPVYAYNLLSPIEYLRPALDIPYCHHEHWNGKGYPRGLKGEQIPLSARIFAVVDTWDALLADRPYRKAWSTSAARAYLHEQASQQFDPEVVEVFLSNILEDLPPASSFRLGGRSSND